MSRHGISADAQIALVQQRIYLHWLALRLSVDAGKQALRERLSAPSMLLTAAGLGFVAGRLSKRTERGRPSAMNRWWALSDTAITALRFAQSGRVLWLVRNLAARAQQPPASAFTSQQR